MTVGPSIAFRFNELDKEALLELSKRLDMNKTQTVRVLVRETLAILKEREQQKQTAPIRNQQFSTGE